MYWDLETMKSITLPALLENLPFIWGHPFSLSAADLLLDNVGFNLNHQLTTCLSFVFPLIYMLDIKVTPIHVAYLFLLNTVRSMYTQRPPEVCTLKDSPKCVHYHSPKRGHSKIVRGVDTQRQAEVCTLKDSLRLYLILEIFLLHKLHTETHVHVWNTLFHTFEHNASN